MKAQRSEMMSLILKGDPFETECPTCEAPKREQCTELPRRRSHSNRMGTRYHASRCMAADALRLFDVTAAGIELFGDDFALANTTVDELYEIDMLLEDTEGVE